MDRVECTFEDTGGPGSVVPGGSVPDATPSEGPGGGKICLESEPSPEADPLKSGNDSDKIYELNVSSSGDAIILKAAAGAEAATGKTPISSAGCCAPDSHSRICSAAGPPSHGHTSYNQDQTLPGRVVYHTCSVPIHESFVYPSPAAPGQLPHHLRYQSPHPSAHPVVTSCGLPVRDSSPVPMHGAPSRYPPPVSQIPPLTTHHCSLHGSQQPLDVDPHRVAATVAGHWYGPAGYADIVDPGTGYSRVGAQSSHSSHCPVHGEFQQPFPSFHPHPNILPQQQQQLLESSSLPPFYYQSIPGPQPTHFHRVAVQYGPPPSVYHPHYPAAVYPSCGDERCPCGGGQAVVGGVDLAGSSVGTVEDRFWHMDAGMSAAMSLAHHPDCQVATGAQMLPVAQHLPVLANATLRSIDDVTADTGEACVGTVGASKGSGDLSIIGANESAASVEQSQLSSSSLSAVRTTQIAKHVYSSDDADTVSSVAVMSADGACPPVSDGDLTQTADSVAVCTSPRLESVSLIPEALRSHTPPERDLNPRDTTVTPVNRTLVAASVDVDNNKAADDASAITAVEEPTAAPPPITGPSCLTFTIDFGSSSGQPQITDHWTHPKPFRSHSGARHRSAAKPSSASKQGDDLTLIKKRVKSLRSSRDKQQSAEAEQRDGGVGYLSDGHGSAVSSDNESSSVCSEMVGRAVVLAGERRLQHFGSTPSRSQPSLIQSKLSTAKLPQKKMLTTTSSQRTSTGKVRPSSAHQPDLKSSSGKKLPSKKPEKETVPTRRSEGSSSASAIGHRINEKTLAAMSSGSRRSGGANAHEADEMLDVTSYLISRMLGSMPARDGSKPTQHSTAVGVIPSTKVSAKAKDASGGDNVSETGTYTIDDEEDEKVKAEVEEARERIENVFGIGDSSAGVDGHGRIVRPVIGSEQIGGYEQQRPGDGDAHDDDVFVGDVAVDDDLQQHYKLKISEALSATNHAIQQVLGLESRKKDLSSAITDQSASSTAEQSATTIPAAGLTSDRELERLSASATPDTSSPSLRECATVVCESGSDFGTFTISYDAPSPRQRRETRSTPRDELTEDNDDSPPVVTPPIVTPKKDSTKIRATPPEQQPVGSSRSRPTRSAREPVTTPVVATETERHPKKLSHAPGKTLSAIPVARSVGDVARASRGENTAPLSRAAPRSGRRTPPTGLQSTLSYWRRDAADMSDAGSETGSTCSVGGRVSGSERRRVAPRSAPVVATRTNRTFALRCAAKQRTESVDQPSSPRAASRQGNSSSRSHSAENNARLALAARSRSGSRVRGSGGGQKDTDASSWRHRQPSGDSSSRSSNLSIATHDGSSFSRRDGGRYSMRVEKSSTTGCLASAARQLQPWEKAQSSTTVKHHGTPRQVGSASSATESKELNAWKRRKEYNARQSVAESKSRRGNSAQRNERSPVSPNVALQDAGRVTADEIAKLSNAVAYNLGVLSQNSQSEAVTLDLSQHRLLSTDISRSAFTIPPLSPRKSLSSSIVATSVDDTGSGGDDQNKNSCDAVLVDSIQQMSSKVKSLTDQLMLKVKEEGQQKMPGDVSGQVGGLSTWQNTSPELAAILENLKRTEQHLQVVHRALFSNEPRSSRRANPSSRLQQQRTVAAQRQQHAQLAGFKPIDNPATKSVETTSSSAAAAASKCRRRSTGGESAGAARKLSSESSSNPLSGDEYY